MLLSVATSKLPWLAAFALILGAGMVALHEKDVGLLLIGAGTAWGTTYAKGEKE